MANGKEVTIKIGGDAGELLKVLSQIQQQLKKTEDDADGASEGLDTFGNRVTKGFQSSLQGLKSAGDQVEAYGKKLSDFSAKTIKYIVGMGTAAAGAIAVAVKSATGVGGDFESQMIRVQSISQATAADFDMLTAKAREMGATLPITAKDAADAMTSLAQRGLNPQQIMDSIDAVTRLSITQQYALEDTAKIVGSITKSFGIDLKDLETVVDALNNASNNSALNMHSIGEAMKYVAPNAKLLGMDLNNTLSAVMALADAGLEGGLIGRGLSGFLATIANPAKAATDAFKRLKVDVRDAGGAIRDWRNILKDMSQTAYTATDIFAIFGQGNADIANTLLNNIDTLDDYEKKLEQVGTTATMLEREMQSFKNTFVSLQSATESVNITFFNQVKEQSKGLLTDLTGMTRELDAWIQKTNAGAKVFDGFLRGLGVSFSGSGFREWLGQLDVDVVVSKVEGLAEGLRSVGQSAAWLFGQVKPLFSFVIDNLETITRIAAGGWVVGKIMSFAGSFLSLSANLKIATGSANLFSLAIGGISTVVSAALSPIGLMTAAIGGLIVVYNKWQDAQKKKRQADRNEFVSEEVEKGFDDLRLAVEGNAEAAGRLQGVYKEAFEGIQQGGAEAKSVWMQYAKAVDTANQQQKKGIISYSEYLQKIDQAKDSLKAAVDGARDLNERLTFRQEMLDSVDFAVHDLEAFKAILEELDAGGSLVSIREKFANLLKAPGNLKDVTTGAEQIKSAYASALETLQAMLPQFSKDMNDALSMGLNPKEALAALRPAFDEQLKGIRDRIDTEHGPAMVALFDKIVNQSMEKFQGFNLDDFTKNIQQMNRAAESGFLGKPMILQTVSANWKKIVAEVRNTVNSLKGIPKNALKSLMDSELLQYLREVGDTVAALRVQAPMDLNEAIKNIRIAVDSMSELSKLDLGKQQQVAVEVAMPNIQGVLQGFEKEYPRFTKTLIQTMQDQGDMMSKDMAAVLSGDLEDGVQNAFAQLLASNPEEAMKQLYARMTQLQDKYKKSQQTVAQKPQALAVPEVVPTAMQEAGKTGGQSYTDGFKQAVQVGLDIQGIAQNLAAGAQSFMQAGTQVGTSFLQGVEGAMSTSLTAKLSKLLDFDATATGAKVGALWAKGFISGASPLLNQLRNSLYEDLSQRLVKEMGGA